MEAVHAPSQPCQHVATIIYHCRVSGPFNCTEQVNDLAKVTHSQEGARWDEPIPFPFRPFPCTSGLWRPHLQNVGDMPHLQ